MRIPAGQHKRVLAYLRDMIELCRGLHRHDLEREYQQAWETAASTIYGALPPRPSCQGYYEPNLAVASAQPTPKWKLEMLAKPYRKIVRRFTEQRKEEPPTEYELLDCGHRLYAGIDLPGSPPARRRRCSKCARENAESKKSVASVSRPPKKEKSA